MIGIRGFIGPLRDVRSTCDDSIGIGCVEPEAGGEIGRGPEEIGGSLRVEEADLVGGESGVIQTHFSYFPDESRRTDLKGEAVAWD